MLSNGIFTTTNLIDHPYTAEDLTAVYAKGDLNPPLAFSDYAATIGHKQLTAKAKLFKEDDPITYAAIVYGIRLGLGLADVLLEKEAINEA